jgi:hypothetical protein
MAKRGPAPNYKPDFCPIAYKFCLLGATNEDLAGVAVRITFELLPVP